MPASPYRILFVCMGNICRSPAGEGVLAHLIRDSELAVRVEIDSAGTIGFHTGKRADPRMRAAASARGIELSSRARQVSRADFNTFDLILAMDDDNRADLEALLGCGNTRAELRSFCDLCTEHDDAEVPDPYYGGDAGFEHVLDLLEDGCSTLIAELETKL